MRKIKLKIKGEELKKRLEIKDGKTPTKKELLELIKPLIPAVKDGKDGKDANATEMVENLKWQMYDDIEALKKKIHKPKNWTPQLKKLEKDLKEYIDMAAIPKGRVSDKGGRFYNWGMPDKGSYGKAISDSRYYQKTEVYTKTEIEALIATENLWDRSGTTLEPHTANDNIDIGSGNLSTTGLITGGTISGGFTAGSIIFSDGSNLAQANANLFWDNTNKRLGIGESSPGTALEVNGDISVPIGKKYYFANIDNPTFYMQYVSNDGLYFVQNDITSLKLGATGTLSHGFGIDTASLCKLQVGSTGSAEFVAIRQTSKDAEDGESMFSGQVATLYSYISGNSYYRTSNNWKSMDTSASAIRFDDGTVEFYADSGLTVDTDYIPTERMRLTVDGKLGIGTTTPAAKLEILSTTDPQLRLTHTDGVDEADFYVNADGDLTITPSGSSVIITGDEDITGNLTAGTIQADDGFTGTGAYTNFTIVGGIITAAS